MRESTTIAQGAKYKSTFSTMDFINVYRKRSLLASEKDKNKDSNIQTKITLNSKNSLELLFSNHLLLNPNAYINTVRLSPIINETMANTPAPPCNHVIKPISYKNCKKLNTTGVAKMENTMDNKKNIFCLMDRAELIVLSHVPKIMPKMNIEPAKIHSLMGKLPRPTMLPTTEANPPIDNTDMKNAVNNLYEFRFWSKLDEKVGVMLIMSM